MAISQQSPIQAIALTLALHLAFIAFIWLASAFNFRDDAQSAGSPVQASLSMNADDIARAKKAIRLAKLEQAQAKIQPKAELQPQTSTQEVQTVAQDWVDHPDQVSQTEIRRDAQTPSDALQEQALKQKQGQVELTDEIKKNKEIENRQRLLKQQLEAVKKARADATKQAQLEEQLLDSLANSGKTPAGNTPATKPPGQNGADNSQNSRYKSALNATARSNWNTAHIPTQTRCQVEFTQIRGGEVIDVSFLSCNLDAQGKESVERALFKSPMPYAGFEAVFQRKVTLLFCFPDEVCQ